VKEGGIERGNMTNLGREEKLEESQLVSMRSLDLMFDLDVFKLGSNFMEFYFNFL
jgi:hypothetical protein